MFVHIDMSIDSLFRSTPSIALFSLAHTPDHFGHYANSTVDEVLRGIEMEVQNIICFHGGLNGGFNDFQSHITHV